MPKDLSKYLSEWTDLVYVFNTGWFIRRSLNSSKTFDLSFNNNKWEFYDCYRTPKNNNVYKLEQYNTVEVAMAAVDDILLRNGYIFISNERFEKLRLLA